MQGHDTQGEHKAGVVVAHHDNTHVFHWGVFYWKLLVPVFFVLVSVGIWLVVQNNDSSEQDVPTVDTLSQAAREGDIDVAIAGYDSYLEQASTDAERHAILLEKATAYMVSGLYEQAIEPAESALALKVDDVICGLLGDAYAATGNTATASAYYKQAISYAQANNVDASYYTQQLEGLGQ